VLEPGEEEEQYEDKDDPYGDEDDEDTAMKILIKVDEVSRIFECESLFLRIRGKRCRFGIKLKSKSHGKSEVPP
jgi:hypothetical protein